MNSENNTQNQENLYGQTRTVVKSDHAIITPDGFVPSKLLHWEGCTPYFVISPLIGKISGFIQILGKFEEKGKAFLSGDDSEQFLYIHKGTVYVEINSQMFSDKVHSPTYEMKADDFLYIPPQHEAEIVSEDVGASFTVFEKKYEYFDEQITLNHKEEPEARMLPPIVHGHVADTIATPFMGYERAMLQEFLPTNDLRYDMAVNLFRYQPGATLPLVETHIMEHGMVMTEGQGIYRLADSYYHVKQDDILWIAPHCPQWYACIGDKPSAYLYYKNVNRHPYYI